MTFRSLGSVRAVLMIAVQELGNCVSFPVFCLLVDKYVVPMTAYSLIDGIVNHNVLDGMLPIRETRRLTGFLLTLAHSMWGRNLD